MRGRGIPAQGRFSSVVKDRSPEGLGSRPLRGFATLGEANTPSGASAETCGQLGSPWRWPQHVPSIIVGKTGGASDPLPFSLTLQTATRRLLTTHPYSSDFPFVFSVVCVSPRFGSRSARRVRFPMGREPPQGAVIPDREKFAIYSHRVKTPKKDLPARNQKVLKRHKKRRIGLSTRLRNWKKSK